MNLKFLKCKRDISLAKGGKIYVSTFRRKRSCSYKRCYRNIDLQTTMYSSDTIQFLRLAEEDGFVERITKERPKSFVIAEVNKMSKVYLSPISSSTLTKRTGMDYNP